MTICAEVVNQKIKFQDALSLEVRMAKRMDETRYINQQLRNWIYLEVKLYLNGSFGRHTCEKKVSL